MIAVDENEFYRQATLRIFSSLNIDTAIESCREYLSGFIPVSGMFFILYEPSLNTSRVMAGTWPDQTRISREAIQMPESIWGWLKEKWQGGNEIRIINDRSQAETPIVELLSTFFHLHTTVPLARELLFDPRAAKVKYEAAE